MDTHATARLRSYTQTNTLAHTHTPRARSCNTRYVGACKRFYFGSPDHEPCSDDPPRTIRGSSDTHIVPSHFGFHFSLSARLCCTHASTYTWPHVPHAINAYAIFAIIIMMIEKHTRTHARDRWALARPPIVRTSAQASACYGGTAHIYLGLW